MQLFMTLCLTGRDTCATVVPSKVCWAGFIGIRRKPLILATFGNFWQQKKDSMRRLEIRSPKPRNPREIRNPNGTPGWVVAEMAAVADAPLQRGRRRVGEPGLQGLQGEAALLTSCPTGSGRIQASPSGGGRRRAGLGNDATYRVVPKRGLPGRGSAAPHSKVPKSKEIKAQQPVKVVVLVGASPTRRIGRYTTEQPGACRPARRRGE
jgi:hypothetical protein